MLPVCTSAQGPYSLKYGDAPGYYYTGFETPGDACNHLAVTGATSVTDVTAHFCKVASSTVRVFPIVKVCDDSPQLTSDKIEDMSALWGAFLVVAIVVFGLKKLLSVFESSPHVDN